MGDERDALLPLIPDDPVRIASDDHLDLRRFARTVAAAATGTRGPFVLGVHGDWGSGKTSVLHLAMELVSQRFESIVPVWFNAWQQELEEQPIAALVLAIEEAIEEHGVGGEPLWSEALEKLRAVLYAVDLKVFTPARAIDREQALASQGREQLTVGVYGQALRALQAALRALPQEGGPAIVVFVDDLDRCERDNALRVLDSLKTVFGEPGLVFVLGLNERVLQQCVQARFAREPNLGEEEDPSTLYHEKNVQAAIEIPPLDDQFEDYLRHLVASRPLDQITGLRELLLESLPAVMQGAGYNPRKAKRMLNTLILEAAVRRAGYRI